VSVATACQTHGAVYGIEVGPQSVSCRVDLPVPLNLSDEDAVLLEANLHNAVELVLARYFPATP
jgi:hypothetical protein